MAGVYVGWNVARAIQPRQRILKIQAGGMERMFGSCAQSSGKEKKKMVVPKDEVIRYVRDCLCTAGAKEQDAQDVAHHLMTADYRGHFSHGMNRMQMYVKDIQNKTTDPLAEPKIVNDFKAVALVDGQMGLGQVIGNFCMKLAIKKAHDFGIGMVSVRGSNHYGICSYYTLMAMKEDLIGFTCTNTSPLMAPSNSREAGLGTNPLCLGMSAANGDEFVLDMATTAVALGKIEIARRKNEAIPEGWALGKDGEVTTDAEKAYEASLLMPLGGEEKNSGYKGYGLALMVEVLCGVLSGSAFGPHIRPWKTGGKVANLGQCFMAINPHAFGSGSKERLSTLLNDMRCLKNTGKEVLVAGDKERDAMEMVDKAGGIEYHPNQIKAEADFAEEMAVKPMELVDSAV